MCIEQAIFKFMWESEGKAEFFKDKIKELVYLISSN